MEDIIIWIVILAIGAGVEFLKKKKAESKGDEDLQKATEHKRQQPRPAPFRASGGQQTFRARAAAPAPAMHAAARPAEASVHAKPAPAGLHSSYRPLAITEEMDMDMTADTSAYGPLMHDSPAPASSGDRERDAHYARWRQAILDTQILERKF